MSKLRSGSKLSFSDRDVLQRISDSLAVPVGVACKDLTDGGDGL